jgi:hypothetical protein
MPSNDHADSSKPFASPGSTDQQTGAVLSPERLRDILASNLMPSEPEIHSIHRAMAQLRGDVHAIQEEYSALEARLRSLKIQELDKLREIRLYSSTLSPVRRLPPELLSQIFEEYNLEDKDFFLPDRFRVRNGPWFLRDVCSRWRAVADSNQALWADIFIEGDHDSMPPSASLLLIQKGLELSGNGPLFVQLEFSRPGWSYQPIFDLLIPHVSRFRKLALAFCTYSLGQLTGSFPPALFSSLKSLKLRALDAHGEHYPELISLFDSAHQLVTVELIGPVAFNLNFRLPNKGVTTLTVSTVAPTQMRPTLFLGFPALVELNFESMANLYITSNDTKHWPRITHPAIRVLRIPSCLHSLLDRFVLPNLEEFYLIDRAGVFPLASQPEFRRVFKAATSSLTTLLGFLQRSSCWLKRLHLQHPCVHRRIIPLIQSPSLDQLETLVLDIQYFRFASGADDDQILLDIMKTLTIPPDSEEPLPSVPLPNLKSLGIHHSAGMGKTACLVSEGTLTTDKPDLHCCVGYVGPDMFNMIKSRATDRTREGVVKLERVDISLAFRYLHLPFFTSELGYTIEEWKRDHIDISIRTKGGHLGDAPRQ